MGLLWGTAMRAMKLQGFNVTLSTFFQVSVASCFILPWLHLWELNFSQCTEEMFLLSVFAGGGASAPDRGHDMEEGTGKHQFRKTVQELRLGESKMGTKLNFLFLPRSFVCLSEIDPKCNAYFSS